jgi:hypothetical protein
MTHIEELILEIYAHHPEKLDAEGRRTVQAHLNICTACRSIANFLHEFYASLAALNDTVSPPVEALVGKLFPAASIIPLYSFRPQHKAELFDSRYTTVLAAMSLDAPRLRFATVATLASEPQKILVRILLDNEANTFKLYVLADEPRKREHAIVSFPSLAVDLATDEKGQVTFELSKAQMPENWATLEAVLRLPLVKFHLTSDQLMSSSRQAPLLLHETSGPDCSLSLVYENKTLTLAAHPRSEESKINLAMIEGDNDKMFLIVLRESKGSIALEPLPQELVIRLYC